MDGWIRTGWSAKAFGTVATAAVLAVLAVPVALAAEDGTDDGTSDDSSTTETLEAETTETLSLLEPTDDPAEAPREPVLAEDDTETVDGSLDTVEDTDDTGTLDAATGPVRGVLLPEDEAAADDEPEPAEEPSEPAGEGGEGDTAPQDEPAPEPGDEPTVESEPLPARPAAGFGARRPFTPDSAAALNFGSLTDLEFGPSDPLTGKLSRLEDPWGGLDEPPPALGGESLFLAGPRAADVVVPTGPRSTLDILESMGAPSTFDGSVARTLAPFPVAGPATYSDDYGAPRHVPSPHAHEGTDIFAPRGTPVIASAAGTIRSVGVDTAIGGNSLKLHTADGAYFYYAHLDGFADGVTEGTNVSLGQVLGYVGDTGNALGTPPHLHYEIHPTGDAPVNPVRFLDRWLANARAAAESLAGASQGVWTPQVAAPAGEPSQGEAAPGTAPRQVAVTPGQDPSLTGADGDTSPLSVAVMIGAVLALFAMLRRPRSAHPSTQPPAGLSSQPATAAPAAAPMRPAAAPSILPLPGEETEPDDEFELVTIGA